MSPKPPPASPGFQSARQQCDDDSGQADRRLPPRAKPQERSLTITTLFSRLWRWLALIRAETRPAFLTFLKTAPRAPSPAQLRTLAIATLAVAVVAGGWLRFANLGGRQMSADEGASWASAAAPTAAAVVRLEARLNPGKLAVNALALHVWMSAFGDSLAAMRSMSAALGTLSILLVFFVTRELVEISQGATADAAVQHRAGPAARRIRYALSDRDGTAVAALSALVFAVNLVTIKYSQEVRMYALMLAASLAQVTFFLRATRRGGLANYAGVAVFTALSLAAQLMTSLMIAAEGLWMLDGLWRARWNLATAWNGRLWRIAAAFAAGIVLLSPMLLPGLAVSEKALDKGELGWITMPAVWEPAAFFNKASGTFSFPVLATLAAFGAYRGWNRARDTVRFALLWMWAPVLMMLAISYVITPVFVERYVLACFAPFFILAALGIWELPSNRARLGALALMAALALGHIYSYDQKPHDFQWREATKIAASTVGADQTIAVAPPYAVDVARYYLRDGTGRDKLTPDSDDPEARVVIISRQGVLPKTDAALTHAYPRLIAELRGIKVRAR